jgi:ketosteroid isomerase-like protein
VSERDVQLHRRLYDAFNESIDAFIALCHPEIEFFSAFVAVSGVSVFRGHDGLREWGRGYEEVWGDEIRVEVETFYDLGEETMVCMVVRGRGRRSGAETTMPVAQVARFHDGLCVYLKSYADKTQALAERGVSHDELEPIAP